MAMLLALVPTLVLAALTIGVARPLALWLVLQRATMSNGEVPRITAEEQLQCLARALPGGGEGRDRR
jgi:hypothetical protein